MIDMNKKYTTRDGRPVRLLCVDGPGGFPVVGIVGGFFETWLADGRVTHSAEMEDDDLIEAPPQNRCGTCRWWTIKLNAAWRICDAPAPYAMASQERMETRRMEGGDCPCWEPKEKSDGRE